MYNMGKSIAKQKGKFCGLEQGPESSENVFHIVDLMKKKLSKNIASKEHKRQVVPRE
jgi:hypothetical protein